MSKRSSLSCFISRSEEETIEIARKMASSWKGDEVVFLEGELGAGKTVFARGLAAGLGVKDLDEVCSPSFTLVNIYKGRCPIFHVDLYRLENETEIRELGWEDWLGQGVIIVEWAEKISFWLTEQVIRVKIEVKEDGTRKFFMAY